MRKYFSAIVMALLVLGVATAVFSVGPGKQVVYDNKKAGKVIFDGKEHAGFKCAACHPKLYKMRPPFEKITMADLNAGKSCAVADCHDGKKSFGVKDCAKCHKK
jgi:c(7)-type cytochrome triheme protein